jgi:YVTN family beta-propeller protein
MRFPLAAGVCVALWLALTASARSAEPYLDRRLEVEGVSMRLQVLPRDETGRTTAVMGEHVDLQVDVMRLADGQPLSNLPIGLWLDRLVSPMSGAVPVCGQRVASFLGGGLLNRPLLDLTGYWVLTMDREGSVSVLDPSVQFAGRSSLHSAIQLGAPPFDWVKTGDDALMFVALPSRNEVATIDLRTLALKRRVSVEGQPTRLALQPDGRLLWVAYRQQAGGSDGVAAIDILDGRVLNAIPLPTGHHEFAFSEDSRFAYVTSRDSGVVSTIDTALGREVARVELGGQPVDVISLDHLGHVWVIDGAQGVIHRLDSRGMQIDRSVLEPGLGPARATPDGRHVLIVNPSQHRIEVVDAASARVLEQVTISGRPYDVMFSELYAYVRTLDIEQVALFPIGRLPKVDLQFIPVGSSAVSALPELPIASTMTPTLERNGGFFVSPSERTLYHYMEGMNAPDSSVRAFGHTPMAAMVAQRGLREVARGRYTTSFRLPSAGTLVLALAAESPRIRECIGLNVDASLQARRAGVKIEWLGAESITVAPGATAELRFRIADVGDAARFVARVISGGGGRAERWQVQRVPGTDEFRVWGSLAQSGGYYVHIESDSAEVRIDAMNAPATVLVVEHAPSEYQRRASP